VIEIWQTDANGIYRHPGDPKTTDRDPHFQFYGESSTELDGRWSFRTIDPGYYEPRPRHIHVKVRIDGDEVLTTQIYFEGDERLAGNAIDEGLIARIAATEEDGMRVLTAVHDLVVDL
jgi:protocatechuate 3,4-dioxygenase beta subunit